MLLISLNNSLKCNWFCVHSRRVFFLQCEAARANDCIQYANEVIFLDKLKTVLSLEFMSALAEHRRKGIEVFGKTLRILKDNIYYYFLYLLRKVSFPRWFQNADRNKHKQTKVS